MLRLIEAFPAGMAARWNKRSFAVKTAIAVLFTAWVAGCVPLNTGMEFNDSEKALLFAYVRFDENTGSARLFLRDLTAKDYGDADRDADSAYAYGNSYGSAAYVNPVLNVVHTTENDTCVLYAGTVSKGKYEIHELAGAHMTYTFAKNAPGNIRVTVGKPEAYLIGQFHMSQTGEGGFGTKGSFSFKSTTGCPNEKTAMRALLKDEQFQEVLDGTPWRDKLVRKVGK